MVFHWSLNDSKFPQISRTFLCILADLSNALVWMVSVRLPLPIPFARLWGPFRAHQLLSVSPSLSCSILLLIIIIIILTCIVFHFPNSTWEKESPRCGCWLARQRHHSKQVRTPVALLRFRLIPLGKAWALLSLQLWVKFYHCSYSTGMNLALNKQRKLIIL